MRKTIKLRITDMEGLEKQFDNKLRENYNSLYTWLNNNFRVYIQLWERKFLQLADKFIKTVNKVSEFDLLFRKMAPKNGKKW